LIVRDSLSAPPVLPSWRPAPPIGQPPALRPPDPPNPSAAAPRGDDRGTVGQRAIAALSTSATEGTSGTSGTRGTEGTGTIPTAAVAASTTATPAPPPSTAERRLAPLPTTALPAYLAPPTPPPPTQPPAQPSALTRRRVPALDGLRAFAIVAVLLYHADFSWARGGFLGVDLFFVLSGYLITGLLLTEHTDKHRISLRRFYIRRARRLLPALFTVIAGTCLYVITTLPHEAATLRGDAAAALGYATNWWLILRGQSYFGGTGRPSLLLNLWSLAVEEQFYLIWPPILTALLATHTRRARHPHQTSRRPSLWPTFFATATLATASALTMTTLYSPWKDPSRVYYGSDTRAFELLIGACLALAIAAHKRTKKPSVAGRDLLGAASLGGLGLAVVAVSGNDPRLYPVGLLAACGAAVLVIRAATADGLVASVLGTKPLVWLGERSYSLYLWHWPVFDVTRPGQDVHMPIAADFTLRFGVSLLLAHLTFCYIERPIRHGAIGRLLARSSGALHERRLALPAAVAALTLGLAACAVGLSAQLTDTARRYPANPNAIAEDHGPALTLAGSAPLGRSAASRPTHQPGTTSAPASTVPIPTAMPAPPAHPPTVAFVGDSQGMTLLLNKPANLNQYLNTLDDTTEGCGLLGGDITSKDGERRNLDTDCNNSTTTWATRVRSQHPDIVVVMIGGWDEFDDTINGTTLTFATTPWDTYYNTRLTTAINQLQATGVPHIELALLPCYRPTPQPGSGYWPERGDDTRTRHINTLLTTYTQTHNNPAGSGSLNTLQPPPAFCDDPAIAQNRDYRWDGTHYYKPGSALYFQSAIPQLLALPR